MHSASDFPPSGENLSGPPRESVDGAATLSSSTTGWGIDRPLKLLLVEDSIPDAKLVMMELENAGFTGDWICVHTQEDYIKALRPDLDIILSDFRLPQFDGFRALSLLKERGWDIPFILVSGTIDQETAVSAIKRGASDYLLKDRLARLGPAVKRALEEKQLRAQKEAAEAGLKRSVAKYLELFENSIVGICLASKEGNFLSANPAAVELLGYASETELRQSGISLTKHVYANPSQFAKFQKIIETNGYLRAYEAEFYRKDGSKIWVSQSGRVIREGASEITGYEIFLEDITRRKETDAQLLKLSRAVEQSPASILICNLKGTIEYVNPRCEQVSGYTANELIGQNPRILKGGQTSTEVYNGLWKAISSGREWSGDLHNRKKSGELFWEHVAISPIRNTAGEITHFLAIKEDITEKRLLEERFLRAQRMENIGRLAGGIAHDLNNILAPIMMSIQMLREMFDQPAAEGILDVIQASSQRGADIVKQVLAFGRGMECRQIEMQPNSIVRELVSMMEQTFPKSIKTTHYCSSSLQTILGDPTQIHQVLLNLCVNARDAMPEGGQIEIRTSNLTLSEREALAHPAAKPGAYVIIEVVDTGVGIPEEIRTKIFDPFFTTKEIGKGTGLGLSTSFGIVQNHGGFMDVASTPGKGTTFKIFLPAIPSIASQKTLAQDLALPRGSGQLILVVDDEVPVRMITKKILSTYGYRCLGAANGKEALSLYLENQAEVAAVITDIMMPVMDGTTLIRALREIDPDIKVIAASGVLLDDQSDDSSSLAAGEVKHFLLKPFSTKSILDTLHFVLSGRI